MIAAAAASGLRQSLGGHRRDRLAVVTDAVRREQGMVGDADAVPPGRIDSA